MLLLPKLLPKLLPVAPTTTKTRKHQNWVLVTPWFRHQPKQDILGKTTKKREKQNVTKLQPTAAAKFYSYKTCFY
jgi:hypothetical protein